MLSVTVSYISSKPEKHLLLFSLLFAVYVVFMIKGLLQKGMLHVFLKQGLCRLNDFFLLFSISAEKHERKGSDQEGTNDVERSLLFCSF